MMKLSDLSIVDLIKKIIGCLVCIRINFHTKYFFYCVPTTEEKRYLEWLKYRLVHEDSCLDASALGTNAQGTLRPKNRNQQLLRDYDD